MTVPAVSGVLLAAGSSRRLGGDVPKQLLPFAGEPLVRRAARAALDARLAELVVVVGPAAGEVRAVLADLPGRVLRVVDNPHHAGGQSSSLRAGLAAVDPGADAALFLPCDQPFLDTATLDRLLDAHAATGAPIVAPCHQGRRGAPVLFARELFAQLTQLRGDAGGRQLLPRYRDRLVLVELERAEPLLDVDTWEDYQRLLALS